VYFTTGSGTLVVRDVPGGSSAAGVLRETLDAWTNDPRIGIVVGDETPVDLGAERPAVRAIYAGTFPEIASPIEGELTVVDMSGTLVMFDAWASEGQFRRVAEDIEAMIRSVTPSP
jgi:hypothetical protein